MPERSILRLVVMAAVVAVIAVVIMSATRRRRRSGWVAGGRVILILWLSATAPSGRQYLPRVGIDIDSSHSKQNFVCYFAVIQNQFRSPPQV